MGLLGPAIVRPRLNHLLWHYLRGELPDWINGSDGPVGWAKRSHRGIQFLDQVHIGEKQRRDIFHKKFTIRYNQAFDEVVRHCADLSREGKTWISPEVAQAYTVLHRAGHAHSYECWMDGKLVGGAFGVQVGGWITVESMFHHVSNASKAAYAQTLLHLRGRGFSFVDVNVVSPYLAYFGAQWVPQWKFEQMMREAIARPLSLADEFPARSLPLSIRLRLPMARIAHALARRILPRRKPPAPQAHHEPAPASPEPAGSAHSSGHAPTPPSP